MQGILIKHTTGPTEMTFPLLPGLFDKKETLAKFKFHFLLGSEH